jgi:hypothetical protein
LLKVLIKVEDDGIISRLIGRDGALSSFYGKNYLGYAVGLYDEMALNNLESIRRIRNVFAHAPSMVSFTLPEVTLECATLHLLKIEKANFEQTNTQTGGDDLPVRAAFVNACLNMMRFLSLVELKGVQRKLRNISRGMKRSSERPPKRIDS